MSTLSRLQEHGIELPPRPTVPTANYVPYVIDGNTVYVSGQTPVVSGEVWPEMISGQFPLNVIVFADKIPGIYAECTERHSLNGRLTALRLQGKCGQEYGVEQGAQAARICGINIIAQLKEACDGDLDRVEQECNMVFEAIEGTDIFAADFETEWICQFNCRISRTTEGE